MDKGLRSIVRAWQNWWTAGDEGETMLVSGTTLTSPPPASTRACDRQ